MTGEKKNEKIQSKKSDFLGNNKKRSKKGSKKGLKKNDLIFECVSQPQFFFFGDFFFALSFFFSLLLSFCEFVWFDC